MIFLKIFPRNIFKLIKYMIKCISLFFRFYFNFQIQLFILEMLDRKINFIIYDFICLDFEMFVSVCHKKCFFFSNYRVYKMLNLYCQFFQIVGTIATYLLILVQLGSSSNVLEKMPNVTTPIVPTRI